LCTSTNARIAGNSQASSARKAYPQVEVGLEDPRELGVVAREHYRRGPELGRGGMGRIVLARDRRLGRIVALKELIDPMLEERFKHEARLTARLQHPAIVTVHEAGRWPSGEPFYAMKYVAGRPLHVVIAEKATLVLLASCTPLGPAPSQPRHAGWRGAARRRGGGRRRDHARRCRARPG